ncbi:MAG TPA: class I SAM-dependent methyltransferase [Alloacidobacterium sp.]|nr:class I SAM-dependent methyltransferase [Alloacidobacterium sp.]
MSLSQTSQPGEEIVNYAYDATFYQYLQKGALRSAQIVVPLVMDWLKIKSILDVGCGAGAWLSVYQRQGIAASYGVDGDYVRPESLLIPQASFIPRDVSQPFDLGERFDLVQCLEVGEHIPNASSKTLVANLVKHSDRVLFSAAVPGQGGENHINEQTYEFWRAHFAAHGYVPYDFLRPLLRGTDVESWYRYNSVLYIAKDAQMNLPADIARTRIPDHAPIPNIAGLPYRLRTRVLAMLPVRWLTRLAVLKHQSLLLTRKITGR